MTKIIEIIFGVMLLLLAIEVYNRLQTNPCYVNSTNASMCNSDNIGV